MIAAVRGLPCPPSCPVYPQPFQAPCCASCATFLVLMPASHSGSTPEKSLSLASSPEVFPTPGPFEVPTPFSFFREIQFSYVSYIFSKVSITRVAALDALGPGPCAAHCSLLLHHQPLRKSHCQSFRLEHNLVTACSGDVVLELDKYCSRFSVSLLSIFRMCAKAPHCSVLTATLKEDTGRGVGISGNFSH